MRIKSQEGEFSFIHRFFAPLAGEDAWNLGDDAAALPILEKGHRFVVSVDNLAEDVHFFSNDPPKKIAQKLIRRNLSDMVAMGAVPKGYFLSLAFNPKKIAVEEWFSRFSEGLLEDQKKYDLPLLGGDTSAIEGKIFLSMTIIGEVASSKILRRSGASPGDGLWVTGEIGNAALGLLAHQGKISDPKDFFLNHYLLPDPPVHFRLGGIASAGMDISDGLLQDAGHLAAQSGVGLVIALSKIPVSESAQPHFKKNPEVFLQGGDDYQLLFTLPTIHTDIMLQKAEAAGIKVTQIGTVVEGDYVVVKGEGGREIALQGKGGWQHF